MKEYPVFVPHGEDRIAGVVTVPDEEPRGLVVLMAGIGAPRSHRYQIWTRAARRLADRGIASVRWDYLGIGDSSGEIRDWRFGDPAVRDEAETVARFAMGATGLERFVAAGNCLGSYLSLELAGAMPECVGAVCIRLPLLEPRRGKLRHRARGWKLGSVVRSNRAVRRLLQPLFGKKRRVRGTLQQSFARALHRGRLLFIYSAEDYTYRQVVKDKLDRLGRSVPSHLRERYELRILPEGRLKGFESLPIQELVIGSVVEWADARFPAAAPVGLEGGRAAHGGR